MLDLVNEVNSCSPPLAGRLVSWSYSCLSENVLRTPSGGHVGLLRRRCAPVVPVRHSHGWRHLRSLRPAEPGPRDGLQPLGHRTSELHSHTKSVCFYMNINLFSIKTERLILSEAVWESQPGEPLLGRGNGWPPRNKGRELSKAQCVHVGVCEGMSDKKVFQVAVSRSYNMQT